MRCFCLLLLITLSSTTTACPDKGVCGNIYDMSAPDAGRDAGLDLAAADQGADAAAAMPFLPAKVTLSQAACLSLQLTTASGTSGDARRTADLKAVVRAGVTVLRGEFIWHHTEKVKGTFDFTAYDRRLKAAEASGIKHVGLLVYGNPWATTKTTSDAMYPPDDPADFATYVSKAVTHYKGRIATYEIWNEPNSGFRFWKGAGLSGDPKAFGALVKAAYKAAKAADPTVQVLFGAPFFNDQVIDGHLKFLAKVYAAHPDIGDHFDGMGLHPYALYPPSAPPEKESSWEASVGRKLAQVRALMASHGQGDKPIYVTEMGWPVWAKVSEAQQASYLVRGFLLLQAAGSNMHCWYTLHDSAGGLTPTEATFGLLAVPVSSAAPREKPAFTAHRVLLETLGAYRISADLQRDQGFSAGTHAYEFTDANSGAKAVAVWSSAPEPAAVTIKLPAGINTVATVSLLGKTGALTPAGGAITLTPTADPMYLLLK